MQAWAMQAYIYILYHRYIILGYVKLISCWSMQYKSLFPDLPKVPESNVIHLLLDRPDQKEWPDYTLFIDATTGKKRSFREFIERARDGATALGSDTAHGGLDLRPENGDVVGILSESCLVRCIPSSLIERI